MKDALTTSSSPPPVSVVVFVRNGAGMIERSLLSALAQEVPGLELLVLDGGSTDGTLETIRRYEHRIAFWRSAADGGPTNAINEGVERATGDVICLLPGDDWLEPGALARVAGEFAADPDLEVLSCGTRYATLDERGSVRVEAEFLDPAVLEFTLDKVLRHPLTAGRFIRRRVYQRFGGHSSEYALGDYDFLVRLCLANVKSKVRPELAYTYRMHPQSTTLSGRFENTLLMMRDNLRITASHLGMPGLPPGHRTALLRVNAGAAARLATMLIRQGQIREALGVVRDASHLNRFWPLSAIGWFAGSIAGKLR